MWSPVTPSRQCAIRSQVYEVVRTLQIYGLCRDKIVCIREEFRRLYEHGSPAPHHPASPPFRPRSGEQVRKQRMPTRRASSIMRLDLHDASCSLLSPSRVAPPSSYRATRRSSLAARRTEGTAVLPPRALPTASITGQYTVAQFFSLRLLPYFLQLGTKLATLAWDGVSTERRWWRVARRSSSYALDQSVAA